MKLRKVLIVILFSLYSIGWAADTLTANQVLTDGAYIASPNGKYTLIMQTDGSLVMYRTVNGTVRYSMKKLGKLARMEPWGNLVEIDTAGDIIWQSGTSTGLTNILWIKDDGDLAITTPGPIFNKVWSIGPDNQPPQQQQAVYPVVTAEPAGAPPTLPPSPGAFPYYFSTNGGL